jgi:hypothetical protein
MQVLHTLYIPPVLYYMYMYMCMHMYTTWQLVHLAHSLGLHVMHSGIKQKLQSPFWLLFVVSHLNHDTLCMHGT